MRSCVGRQQIRDLQPIPSRRMRVGVTGAPEGGVEQLEPGTRRTRIDALTAFLLDHPQLALEAPKHGLEQPVGLHPEPQLDLLRRHQHLEGSRVVTGLRVEAEGAGPRVDRRVLPWPLQRREPAIETGKTRRRPATANGVFVETLPLPQQPRFRVPVRGADRAAAGVQEVLHHVGHTPLPRRIRRRAAAHRPHRGNQGPSRPLDDQEGHAVVQFELRGFEFRRQRRGRSRRCRGE